MNQILFKLSIIRGFIYDISRIWELINCLDNILWKFNTNVSSVNLKLFYLIYKCTTNCYRAILFCFNNFSTWKSSIIYEFNKNIRHPRTFFFCCTNNVKRHKIKRLCCFSSIIFNSLSSIICNRYFDCSINFTR